MLCDTGDAFRLGLSQARLRQLDSMSGRENINDADDIGIIKSRHLRLARLLNEEDRCWDFVCKSMDSYIQRLGTSSKTCEPCEEYTLLNERGSQILIAFKRHSTRF